MTWMIESDDSHQEQVSDLQKFETTICELLYTIHNKKDPKSVVDQNEISKWCMPATKDAIFKSKNLYFILGEDDEPE